MKEIHLHYYIPEDEKELESLVGKPVGVVGLSDSLRPVPYLYAGVHKDRYNWDRHEFFGLGTLSEFESVSEKSPRKTRILQGYGLLKNAVVFREYGIDIERHFIAPVVMLVYFEDSHLEIFQERLELIKHLLDNST